MVTAVMSFLMTNTFERGGRFAADTKHLPPRLHTMASVRVAFWGGGRAPCPGPRGTSSRMGPSIRCDDDPSHPCGVRLVQLCLIGQEQSVWHSADTRWDPDSHQPLIII